MVGLVAIAVLGIGFAALWTVFAIRPLVRAHHGGAGVWTFALAQLSLIAACIAGFRYGAGGAVFGAAFPPMALWVIPDVPVELTMRVLPFALIGAAVAAAAAIVIRPIRPVAILVVALGFWLGFVVPGDRLSRAAMCDAAWSEGLQDVRRNSLAWSVMNTGREFQFGVHALAERGDDSFAWSYGEMAWYRVPDTAAGNVDTGSARCP